MSSQVVTTPQSLIILELSFQLDVELAYYDAAMAEVIYHNQNQKMNIPERRGRKRRQMWVKDWLLGHGKDGTYHF